MFNQYSVPDEDDPERFIFGFKECQKFIMGVTGNSED
jgi:hypothetical protein